MNKPISITIKLTVLALLATLGIIYILEKPPVSEVSNYRKEESRKPYSRTSSNFFSSQPSADGDAVSITGGSGAYDEVRIGGTFRSEKESSE